MLNWKLRRITFNMFGEDIDIVAYKSIDDVSVEAFLVKDTDSPPVYPNSLTSSNEIPPIVVECDSSNEIPLVSLSAMYDHDFHLRRC